MPGFQGVQCSLRISIGALRCGNGVASIAELLVTESFPWLKGLQPVQAFLKRGDLQEQWQLIFPVYLEMADGLVIQAIIES